MAPFSRVMLVAPFTRVMLMYPLCQKPTRLGLQRRQQLYLLCLLLCMLRLLCLLSPPRLVPVRVAPRTVVGFVLWKS